MMPCDVNGHKLEKVSRKPATEIQEGNEEYYTCSECGKYFSDAQGKNEITKDSWIIPKTQHVHTLRTVDAKAATCTEAGSSAYWTCSGCGKYFSDAEATKEIVENSWVIKATGHTLTKTEAKDPTETQAGNSIYWTCSICNKFFSDSQGKTEISENSWIIPVLDHTHNLEATPAKDATCIEIGNTAYWTCSGCGKYFSDAEGENEITADDWVIKASGHKLVHIDEKSPTETEDGNTEYWSCSVCEKYFSDANGEIEIDKSDWFIPAVSHVHKPEVIPAVASTCTKPGFTEGSKCSVCGEILKSQTVIPAKGHTPVEDPAVEPTTTTTGLTAGSHCSVCGEILLKQEVIPKKSDSGQENSGQGNNEQGNNEQGNNEQGNNGQGNNGQGNNGQGNNGQGNNGQGNNGQGNNRQETAKQNKNPQPMTVKVAKQKTVKFSRLKKKAQTVKPITVKSAQGTVSYKITGGSKKSKKALKMSAKTGKITVKRGTKKGIYKLKVTVKAAGNAEYDAGSKTVNVSVKVK